VEAAPDLLTTRGPSQAHRGSERAVQVATPQPGRGGVYYSSPVFLLSCCVLKQRRDKKAPGSLSWSCHRLSYIPPRYPSKMAAIRGNGFRTSPLSQAVTVEVSSPSFRASPRCEMPSRRRVARMRSDSETGAGHGSYSRKRMIFGQYLNSGSCFPCSQLS
jgi:hypothetical protein